MNPMKSRLAAALALLFLAAPAFGVTKPTAEARPPPSPADPLWPQLGRLAPTNGVEARDEGRARLRPDATWPEIRMASPAFTLPAPAHGPAALDARHLRP